MLSLKTLKKRANYSLYFCHQIKGKSYLRITCKHGHYCIIFQPSKKREKSVNKSLTFLVHTTCQLGMARQMSWEPLEALWSYSNINAETHLSFRFGMHNADQFHFYFFAFAVIPILLNFDFRRICKKKDSNVYLFVYYIHTELLELSIQYYQIWQTKS